MRWNSNRSGKVGGRQPVLHRAAKHHRLAKKFIIMLPLLILIAAWSTTTTKTMTTEPIYFAQEQNKKHAVDGSDGSVAENRTTIYYSVARVDRSGSAIHDMLLAQAYAYQQGGVYGGACLRWLPSRRDTVRLLRETGLHTVLPHACPRRSRSLFHQLFSMFDSSTAIASAPSEIVLPESLYRKLDNALFTGEWRQDFLQRYKMPVAAAVTDASQDDAGDDDSLQRVQLYHIVVHVRRGDIEPCNHPKRYLPNSHYLNLIEQQLPKNQNDITPVATKVTIYSQRMSYESFDVFEQLNYTVRLDSPLSQVWMDLMTAQVAILSQSSFSYVPAVLNNHVGSNNHNNNHYNSTHPATNASASASVVVYTPFAHKPVTGWTVVDNDLLDAARAESMSMQAAACQAVPGKKRGWYKKYVRQRLKRVLLYAFTDRPNRRRP